MRAVFIALLVAFVGGIAAASTVEGMDTTASLLFDTDDNYGTTTRNLRTNAVLYDDERAMQIPGNSKLAKLLSSKGPTISVKDKLNAWNWIRKKDSVDTVFKRLQLDSGIDKVLSNPKIMAWVTYMDLFNKKYPDKKVTMVGLLTKTYGNLRVARMLQLMRNAKTKGLVGRLMDEQLNAWKDAKKSSDEIFSLLDLDKAGYHLFRSPQLNSWYNYVVMLNKNDPEAEMVNILAGWYGHDGLAKIFILAEPPLVKRMRQIEVKLQTAMERQWLNQNKSPEDVFKLLKLDDEVGKVLTTPTFKTWLGYLDYFNFKKPATVDAISVSTNVKITNAVNLPHSLMADQKVPVKRLLRTAKRTDEDDEERAFNAAKIDDAFISLKLDKVSGNLFENPNWKKWTEQVAKASSNDVDDSILSSLTRRYKVDGVTTLLASAKNTPATSELAAKLEALRLKQWLNAGFEPGRVFGMLKLDVSRAKMFDSPQLEALTKYVALFNSKHLRQETTVLQLFSKHYDGDDAFLKVLVSAENANSVGATKLKNEMVKSWLDQPNHPANVFKALKLDEAGDNLLSSPILSTWVQYMKAFNKQYPLAETTMIKTFTKSYGDEKLATMLEAAKKVPNTEQLAKNLQAAQFSQWMTENKTPKEMLSVLKLSSQTFNDNPSAAIWRSYNKAYAKKFSDTDFAFQP
ncbi:Avirulence protein (Avh) [Phytophthora palmivora]|uniref:Avirulence protein (Avh) n=1 Tax=Phytophthora palmivora TaxID=4796 RepID=A0A2P4XAU3_9STRA|nr:Avirulence protein (Avh) [Phytophthora palmivora]